jgi:hypothetical protein
MKRKGDFMTLTEEEYAKQAAVTSEALTNYFAAIDHLCLDGDDAAQEIKKEKVRKQMLKILNHTRIQFRVNASAAMKAATSNGDCPRGWKKCTDGSCVPIEEQCENLG